MLLTFRRILALLMYARKYFRVGKGGGQDGTVLSAEDASLWWCGMLCSELVSGSLSCLFPGMGVKSMGELTASLKPKGRMLANFVDTCMLRVNSGYRIGSTCRREKKTGEDERQLPAFLLQALRSASCSSIDLVERIGALPFLSVLLPCFLQRLP